MNKQVKSIKSFSEQHKLSISRIHPLTKADFETYRMHEILGTSDLSGLDILDVGCGTGRVTSHLISSNPSSVQCIDPSITEEDFQNNLNRNIINFSGALRFTRASAVDFTSEKKYDLIFIIGVLHHIPENINALRNLSHLLSPSGNFVIWVYSKEIGLVNRAFLQLSRFIFPYLGFFRIPFTKLLRVLMVLLGKFLSPSSEIRILVDKDKDESILALYDQLNAGYAKYYSKQDVLNEAKDAGLRVINILPTGRKGWTITYGLN
jgi:SAM-dependent methyltransferase